MKNLIPHFIQDKYVTGRTKGNFSALTMFLDISGFTPMTERLMREGKEGAEVLSAILNNIFYPIIHAIYDRGGFISTFAGDAFTCVFPNVDNPISVVYSADKVNKLFKEIGTQKTKFGDFKLSVKLGLSAGNVDWGIIGSDEHKTYYLRGEAINGCAYSEHHCDKMDIVLDDNIYKLVRDKIDIKYLQSDKTESNKDKSFGEKIIEFFSKIFSRSKTDTHKYNSRYYLLEAVKDKESEVESSSVPIMKSEVLENFIPNKVLETSQKGEFRNLVSVFISFKEPDSFDELNELTATVIKETDNLGGYFNKIDFGDKGGVMLILFGAPMSYENDRRRGLDLIYTLKQTFKDQIRAGITYGIAFSGFVGSDMRSEYTALGDIVNQSARFMMKADWEHVWLSEQVHNKTRRQFHFENIGKHKFKGKSEPIQVYELLKKSEDIGSLLFEGDMVGRTEELSKLKDWSKTLYDGKFAGIVYLYGEAGMGKSRLAYEFTNEVKDNITTYQMQTDSILKKSLNPIIYFLNDYFNQNTAHTKKEHKANFENVFDELIDNLNALEDDRKDYIVKELIRTKSIISAQINIYYKDSLYEELDPKLRYENSLFAVRDLFRGLSLINPLIILLEDIHWLDIDTHKVFDTMTKVIDGYPIMIIATSRFNDDGSKPKLQVDKKILTNEIVVDKLTDELVKSFIELQFDGNVSDEMVDFVNSKAENNPFYIEQICLYVSENKLIEKVDGKYTITNTQIEIPSDISSIIISRIDRLSMELKEVIQVASILGREVEIEVLLMMVELYKSALEGKDIDKLFKQVEDEQVWSVLSEIKYLFKHALLREAVYEMQLRERLRKLHKLAGDSMEEFYKDSLEKYKDIAYHYEKAEVFDKSKMYYEKAGDYFKEKFKNDDAISMYDKVLELGVDKPKQVDIIKNKADILDHTGKWDDAIELLNKGIKIAEEIEEESPLTPLVKGGTKGGILGELKRSLGGILMNRGKYDEAMSLYEEAKTIAEEIGDRSLYSKAVRNMGSVYWNKGDYDSAMRCYEEDKQICEELGDRSGYSIAVGNMGIVYAEKGDYDSAMRCNEEDKQICEELGDRSGYSIAVGNMGIVYAEKGDYDSAMRCNEEQKQICEELGDRRGYSMAVGCMGIVYADKGDYDSAMRCYEKWKQICEELGDRRGYSMAVGCMGIVYADKGDYDSAMRCYEKWKQICEELGDRRWYSMTVGNMGNVYLNKGDYDSAMRCYDEAIEIGRELGIKYYLCSYLNNKAKALFETDKPSEAKPLNEEALQMAKEVNSPDDIFEATVLMYKIASVSDKTSAVKGLAGMLRESPLTPLVKGGKDEEATLNHQNKEGKDSEVPLSKGDLGGFSDDQIATIHYELWKLTGDDTHRVKAVDMYRAVYEKTPDYEFKKRIEEMSK